MSTRCTVVWGSDFHLYEEVFDDKNIYLELSKPSSVLVEVDTSELNKTTNLQFSLSLIHI